MRYLLPLLCLALAACGATGAKPVESPGTHVSVPVMVPCVSGARPSAVAPLSSQYGQSEWDSFTVKQKADLVGAAGLKHQTRAEMLDAATSACP